jgi:cleavage and polyadenylation specificity factor subunit 1
MHDEKTDAELKVVSSSFCDPYLLIIRDDASVVVLSIPTSGELEELDGGDCQSASKWRSGHLYRPAGADAKPLAFLLTTQGSLRVSLVSPLPLDGK